MDHLLRLRNTTARAGPTKASSCRPVPALHVTLGKKPPKITNRTEIPPTEQISSAAAISKWATPQLGPPPLLRKPPRSLQPTHNPLLSPHSARPRRPLASCSCPHLTITLARSGLACARASATAAHARAVAAAQCAGGCGHGDGEGTPARRGVKPAAAQGAGARGASGGMGPTISRPTAASTQAHMSSAHHHTPRAPNHSLPSDHLHKP